MTLVIFGVGALVFLVTVYGTVVAGGLRLTVRQLDDQPALAAEAGLGDDGADDGISVRDVADKEF